MAPTATVAVQVTGIDVGCDACGGYLTDVPTEMGGAWLESHRRPALLALNVQVNGSPSRWVRRRRIA